MAVPLKQLLFPLPLFSFILVDQAQIAEAFIVEADPVMLQYSTELLSTLPRGKDDKPAPAALDCGGLCGARCSQHSRPNLCMRACGTCCFRCNCVPPVTSSNRTKCP